MTSTELEQAQSKTDYAVARALFEEYAAALNVDLCFQSFAEELATLETHYGPPGGCLLLARENGEWVGCVALRSRDRGICEMKRLYVKPGQRERGTGRLLATAIIECARQLHYQSIVLDTLQSMTEAKSLYASLGFREIEGYYANPLQGVRYLALDLAQREQPNARQPD